jgi:hypothetical protein
MGIAIGGEVNEQIFIDQRLGSGADIFSTQSPRFVAVRTVAEQRGKSLRGCRAKIGDGHKISSLIFFHYTANAPKKEALFSI